MKSTVKIILVAVLIPLFLLSCDRIAATLNSGPVELTDPHVKILFVGDTSFGESYDGTPQLLAKRGYDHPMEKVAPLLKSSDLVIANLETPITDIEKSPFADSKDWTHWTHVEHAPATLKKYNIRTVSLANNHTLDFGVPGLQQTFDVLKKNGMEWLGAGMNEEEASRPLIKTFDVGGKPFKMAVIAPFEYRRKYDVKYDFYAKGDKPGAMMLSEEVIEKIIARIKAEDPDTFVVLFSHWGRGRNYAWKNSQEERLGRRFIRDGADLVIGHGSHTMQEIERYNDKWIVYGLGNFVFLSPGRYKNMKSAPFCYTAQLIVENQNGALRKRVRLYPIHTDNRSNKFQARPLNDQEFEKFVTLLMEKSPLTDKQAKKVVRGRSDLGQFVEFML